MDIFAILMYCLGILLFLGSIATIISYLRFHERNQRLPEACKFIDLEQKIDNLEKKEKELEDKTRSFEERKAELQMVSEELKAKKAWLDEHLPELQLYDEQLKKLEAAKAEYDDCSSRSDVLNHQIQEKKEKSSALDGTISSMKGRRQLLKSEIEDFENLLSSMKNDKVQLETAYTSLVKDITEKENEKRKCAEELAEQKNKLASISKEYSEKKATLDTYEIEKTALLKQIEILKKSLDHARRNGRPTSNEEMLKDLWEPIVFPKLSPAEEEKSEQDMLADLKNYIRGKNLYFPDRVIHAFHTSMKCNDISPLTVLAGISGTGKSELPKCYAEGMGIHFAMLSVQPRWDSPQDLLGFYNYMENKYKATELARAMVRFDPFNRSSWGELPKECDDRSDRMLLVLLDEMNLARVEYYFSEFLSKLETRRGVNLKDEKDRVKAEIELELTGRTPLRIFAGRNILFTGTMNEDESTQTLSDKVLDRANVLRFGKPKSANIADKIRNSKYIAPPTEGLTYERWKGWCTDSQNVKMDDQISDWINRLNNAMEELQKPFGHRVAQAIATYIANYPEDITNEDKKQIAFADQIEQRIMPKLRGIDLESYKDPLEKIGNLIMETHDDALYFAYEKGLNNNSNGIFLWQGVDRSEDN